MSSCELSIFISTLACSIFECCGRDESTLLSAIFLQLSDSLNTILVHDEICSEKNVESSENIGFTDISNNNEKSTTTKK